MPLPPNPLSMPFAACSGEHLEKVLAAILEDSDQLIEIACGLEYDVEGTLRMALLRQGAAVKAFNEEMLGLSVVEQIAAPGALSEEQIQQKILNAAQLAREVAVGALSACVVMSTLEEWSQT